MASGSKRKDKKMTHVLWNGYFVNKKCISIQT